MTTSLISRTAHPDADAGAHTLVGEHWRLMRDVERQAAPVLALLDARAWPHAELGSLVNWLRGTGLRQASDEEVHLFPPDSSAPPFAELSADHARLHGLTAQLDQVYATPCPLPRLRALVEDLLATLRRHLEEEQRVLAALPIADGEVPGAAEVAAGTRTWLPAGDAPVRLDPDLLPTGQEIELSIERLLRLRPGQTAELHSHDDRLLQDVCRWLRSFDPARFGFGHASTGLAEHLLRVTRRHDE